MWLTSNWNTRGPATAVDCQASVDCVYTHTPTYIHTHKRTRARVRTMKTAVAVLVLCSLVACNHAGNTPSITLERLIPSQSQILNEQGSHPNFGRRLQNVKEQSMFKVVSPSSLAEKVCHLI